jgi:hypothetical protein
MFRADIAVVGRSGVTGATYDVSVTSLWWLRLVIMFIGVAVGVMLLLSHHVLVGGLILLLAVARGVLVLTLWKRRAAFRTRRGGGFGRLI